MIRLIKLLSILLVVFVWNSPMRADTNMKQGEDLLKPVPWRARSIKGGRDNSRFGQCDH
jgi:hypothetical protein